MNRKSNNNPSLENDVITNKKTDGQFDLDITSNPLELVRYWLDDAKSMGLEKADAMNIATVGSEGTPRNRMVLMRHLTTSEIGFFTNLSSDKSKEIIANPNISATLWWPTMDRQIRVEGTAKEMNRDIVQAYFDSRPRKSQIAAWASKQSQHLESIESLHKRFEDKQKKFADREIPLPDFWGGFTISIRKIEFWLGKPFRLHERIVFTKDGDNWLHSRLYP